MKSIVRAFLLSVSLALPLSAAPVRTELTWKLSDLPLGTELKLKRAFKTEAETTRTKIELSENGHVLVCVWEPLAGSTHGVHFRPALAP